MCNVYWYWFYVEYKSAFWLVLWFIQIYEQQMCIHSLFVHFDDLFYSERSPYTRSLVNIVYKTSLENKSARGVADKMRWERFKTKYIITDSESERILTWTSEGPINVSFTYQLNWVNCERRISRERETIKSVTTARKTVESIRLKWITAQGIKYWQCRTGLD